MIMNEFIKQILCKRMYKQYINNNVDLRLKKLFEIKNESISLKTQIVILQQESHFKNNLRLQKKKLCINQNTMCLQIKKK